MSTFFKNKIVWITGASSGIGRDIALLLAHQGAHLILSSSSEERLKNIQNLCIPQAASCQILPVNLAKPDQVILATRKARELHQRIDVLILNAGISQRSFIQETPYEVHQLIFQVNYFSNVQLIKQLLPMMIEQGGAHLAVTGSITGKFGFPLRSAYSASKHALHGFFETLRLEHREDAIHVSMILPGRVNTNISLNAVNAEGKKHGKMDDGQAGGISSTQCAKKYLKAIEKGKKEVLIGGKELMMVHIRRFFPALFYRISQKIKPT